jgi:hypothetical protein
MTVLSVVTVWTCRWIQRFQRNTHSSKTLYVCLPLSPGIVAIKLNVEILTSARKANPVQDSSKNTCKEVSSWDVRECTVGMMMDVKAGPDRMY